MTLPNPEPSLVARLRAAGCVFAEEEAAALQEAAGSPEQLESMTVRRTRGEPLEQIIGWASFAGVRVRLLPGVFVPRRRSELMVRLAAQRLTRGPVPSPRLLDLGCGSGGIGAAVAARAQVARTQVEVWACDLDPDAVACARLNLPEQQVLLGDLYAPLPDDLRVDVICANVPYVPTDAIALMPPEARDHEHRIALDGGPDGLSVQRRVVVGARDHLLAGGSLLVETSRIQAPLTADLARAGGLSVEIHTDDEVDGTVVEARAD